MSLMRTLEPSGRARTMMFSNAPTSSSRPCVRIVYWNCWSGSLGAAPIWPAATCTFCSRTARTTSLVAMPRLAMRPASSHIRML